MSIISIEFLWKHFPNLFSSSMTSIVMLYFSICSLLFLEGKRSSRIKILINSVTFSLAFSDLNLPVSKSINFFGWSPLVYLFLFKIWFRKSIKNNQWGFNRRVSLFYTKYYILSLSTLESGISVALQLLIFWLFSRGYGLIPDFIV